MLGIIFAQTTTIGVRIQQMERAVLPREIRQVATSLGEIRVKTVTLPDGKRRSYPEYDDVATVCRSSGLSFPDVYNTLYSETNLPDGR